jgi:hypothetical protein
VRFWRSQNSGFQPENTILAALYLAFRLGHDDVSCGFGGAKIPAFGRKTRNPQPLVWYLILFYDDVLCGFGGAKIPAFSRKTRNYQHSGLFCFMTTFRFGFQPERNSQHIIRYFG